MKTFIKKYWFFIALLFIFAVVLTISLVFKHFKNENQREYFLITFKNSDYPFQLVVHKQQTFANVLQEITNRNASGFQEKLKNSTITHLPQEIITKDLQLIVQWKF